MLAGDWARVLLVSHVTCPRHSRMSRVVSSQQSDIAVNTTVITIFSLQCFCLLKSWELFVCTIRQKQYFSLYFCLLGIRSPFVKLLSDLCPACVFSSVSLSGVDQRSQLLSYSGARSVDEYLSSPCSPCRRGDGPREMPVMTAHSLPGVASDLQTGNCYLFRVSEQTNSRRRMEEVYLGGR